VATIMDVDATTTMDVVVADVVVKVAN